MSMAPPGSGSDGPTQPPGNWPSQGQPYRPVSSGSAPGGPYGSGPTYGQVPPARWGSGTEVLGDEPPAPRLRRKRSATPWIVSGVVLAVVGGGAVAVQAALGGGGAQPAAALPGNAVMYGRIDLDPSGAQKIAALRFAGKFPDFGQATGITDASTDVRRWLLDQLTEDTPHLSAVDYDTDIAPWIGSRVGVALVPVPDGEDSGNGVVVALQVTDQDAARDGLDKLWAMSPDGEVPGVAFSGDYALFAANQDLADEYAADASESSLADQPEFSDDMEALGDAGVASAWIGPDAFKTIADLESSADAQVGGAALPDLSMFSSSQAVALRFNDRYAELAYVQSGSTLPSSADTGPNPIIRLPRSTVFAASVAGGNQLVEQYWDSLTQLSANVDAGFQRELRQFERSTGLSVPDDIATLFGDNLVVALDGQGLDSLDGADPSDVPLGLLLDTDPEAAKEIVDKIVAASGGGLSLQTVETDGMLAVSPSADYAGQLADGDLGASDVFSLAVPNAEDAQVALFLSIDAIEESSLFRDNFDAATADNLAPLQAIGLSQVVDGDQVRGSLRIVADR